VKFPRGFPPVVTHARSSRCPKYPASDRVLSRTLRYFTARAFFSRPLELREHPSASYIGGVFFSAVRYDVEVALKNSKFFFSRSVFFLD
jgi:hypothetical protein